MARQRPRASQRARLCLRDRRRSSPRGGEPDAGVVAFNAETGKTVWQNVGKAAWKSPDGDQLDDKLASYSSLIGAKIHDHEHIFSLMRDGLVSLNPADGKSGVSVAFATRPLWLLRGKDQTGRNDFKVGFPAA